MHMMLTKVRTILRVGSNIASESSRILRINSKLLLRMPMMLIRVMNILKVESNTALD